MRSLVAGCAAPQTACYPATLKFPLSASSSLSYPPSPSSRRFLLPNLEETPIAASVHSQWGATEKEIMHAYR